MKQKILLIKGLFIFIFLKKIDDFYKYFFHSFYSNELNSEINEIPLNNHENDDASVVSSINPL